MKHKCLLVLTILSLFSLQYIIFGKLHFWNEFQLERLTSNFNGSIFYQNVILVYGTGGIILRSSDEGKSWEQICLNDSLKISKIIVYDDKFYGIATENFIIKSTDNGLTWDLVRFSEPSEFFNIFAYNGNLYVIGNEAIFVLSLELEVIDKLPITANSDEQKLSLSNPLILDNKIVFLTNNNKIKVVPFNALQSINSNDNIYEICSWCKSLGTLFSNGNNLIFFTYTDSLFSFNLNTLQREFIGSNYNFRNSLFFTKDSTIYFAFNKLDKPRSGINPVTKKYDKIFFGKIDLNNKEILIYGQDTSNPFLSQLYLNSINFSEKGKIILVGKNKLIYLSDDFGNNWRIVSYMSGSFSVVHFFNSQRIIIYENYGIFINSTDGGVTWQPSLKYPEKFHNNDFTNPSQIVFTGNDDGMVYFFIYPFTYGPPNLIYSQDYGKTFLSLAAPIQSNNYLFAKAFNTNIFYHRPANLPDLLHCFSFLQFEKDTVKILKQKEFDPNMAFQALYSSNDTLYGLVTMLNNQKPDSSTNNKQGSDTFFIYFSPDTASSWKLLMSLTISDPEFPTKPNLQSTYLLDSLLFIIYSNSKYLNDSLSPDIFKGIEKINILVVNLNSKTFRKIYEYVLPDSLFINFRLWKIGNYLFLNIKKSSLFSNTSEALYSKLDNIQDLPNWKKFSEGRYIYPNFDLHRLSYFSYPNGFYSDTLFPIVALDTLHYEIVLFKAKLKKDSYLTKDTTFNNRFLFYFSQPIPNPSKGKTRFLLYFEPKYYIEDFKFYLFDLAGKQVNLLDGISINQSTPYSGEIILDTQNLSVGIYLFVAKLGNTVNSVPLIVE